MMEAAPAQTEAAPSPWLDLLLRRLRLPQWSSMELLLSPRKKLPLKLRLPLQSLRGHQRFEATASSADAEGALVAAKAASKEAEAVPVEVEAVPVEAGVAPETPVSTADLGTPGTSAPASALAKPIPESAHDFATACFHNKLSLPHTHATLGSVRELPR